MMQKIEASYCTFRGGCLETTQPNLRVLLTNEYYFTFTNAHNTTPNGMWKTLAVSRLYLFDIGFFGNEFIS